MIPRSRTALKAAAATAAVLALLGADGGCSASPTPDGVTFQGGTLLGRCTHRVSAPYVNAGRVTAYSDVQCREAVLRSDLTVTLQKRGPSGQWTDAATAAFNTAPAVNTLKKGTASIGCAPGLYRTTIKAYVQMLNQDDHQGDSGSAQSPEVTVNASQCA